MASYTEENYLKTIYHLSQAKSGHAVNTNELAISTNTKAASVTDMIKRLSEKNLVFYTKYQGVTLTDEGSKIALKIVRKHRLWEVFLVEKLGFKWDEIHEIAEELEHINSLELTEKLSAFLNHPKFDPHGDPIPDQNGVLPNQTTIVLPNAPQNKPLKLKNVSEDSQAFLQHLDKLGIKLGCTLEIKDISVYDQSVHLILNNQITINISQEVANNLFVVF